MRLKFNAWYIIVGVTIVYKRLMYYRSVRDLVPVSCVIVLCAVGDFLQVTSWYVDLLKVVEFLPEQE